MNTALTFSLTIVGVLLMGAIVSLSLGRKGDGDCDNKVKNVSNMKVSNTSRPSNFASLNVARSNNNLTRQMSQVSYNPYLSSAQNSVWSYGTYRG